MSIQIYDTYFVIAPGILWFLGSLLLVLFGYLMWKIFRRNNP
jgi:hypothetical protein